MLLIKFKIGDEYYALNTETVIEVIPLISLRRIPGTPSFFSGIFDYRGQIVPVIDITELTLGRPSVVRLNTRVILISFPFKEGEKSILGLMAEAVTDTLDIDESAFQDTGISFEKAPYLGPIAEVDGKFIQSIQLDRLLSKDIQKTIFSAFEL